MEILEQTNKRFMEEFIHKGGVAAMIEAVLKIEKVSTIKTIEETHTQIELLKIFVMMINSPNAIDLLVLTPHLLENFTLIANSSSIDVRQIVYEILAVVVILRQDEGHKKVIKAMDYYAYKFKETRRFEGLVHTLRFESSHELVRCVLTLIVSLINTPDNVFERMSIRNEFIYLGIEQLLYQKQDENDVSDEVLLQLNAFQQDLATDEEIYAFTLQHFDKNFQGSNIKDPHELFNLLLTKIEGQTNIQKKVIEFITTTYWNASR